MGGRYEQRAMRKRSVGKDFVLCDEAIILGLSDQLRIEPIGRGTGAFVMWQLARADSWAEVVVGKLARVDQWVCCWRPDPFWMLPAVGLDIGKIPAETQFLLVKRTDGWLCRCLGVGCVLH